MREISVWVYPSTQRALTSPPLRLRRFTWAVFTPHHDLNPSRRATAPTVDSAALDPVLDGVSHEILRGSRFSTFHLEEDLLASSEIERSARSEAGSV